MSKGKDGDGKGNGGKDKGGGAKDRSDRAKDKDSKGAGDRGPKVDPTPSKDYKNPGGFPAGWRGSRTISRETTERSTANHQSS